MTKVAASKERVTLFLPLVFYLLNSADSYEMLLYAASYLNLHSFDNVSVEGFPVKKMVDKGLQYYFRMMLPTPMVLMRQSLYLCTTAPTGTVSLPG